MVGWWPGDGNAKDIEGSNSGTLVNGANFDRGVVGPAFSFKDAEQQYVKAPDSAALNFRNSITIDAWVMKRGSCEWLNCWLVMKHRKEPTVVSEDNSYGIFIADADYWSADQNHRVGFSLNTGSWEDVVLGTTLIQENVWYHVAGTWDGNQAKIYVNGNLENSVAKTGTLLAQDGLFYIGAAPSRCPWGGDCTEYFEGLIDEVEVFNRALSGPEIKAIYDAREGGKCKPESLAAFTLRAEFTLGPKANDDSFKASGWLKLADTSNGIDPLTEPVTIQVGSFSHSIPAGSFKQEGNAYKYVGAVGQSKLDVAFWPQAKGGTYWFKTCLKSGSLGGTTMKPQVQLRIGDDQGQATLDVGYAKFGKGSDRQKWVFPPVQ